MDNENYTNDDQNFEQQENQYLTFTIGEEVYGINILNVLEIIRVVNITSVPDTFEFIKGIINLRGKIIPIMDVRIRFGFNERAFDDRTCIIVVNINNIEMGLIVDRVSEVLEIPSENIEPMPSLSQSGHQKFIKGIGKTEDGVKILLDLDKLLFESEIKQIKEIDIS